MSSPIAKVSGLQESDVDLDRWQRLGELMSTRLKQPSFDDASEEQRQVSLRLAAYSVSCMMRL